MVFIEKQSKITRITSKTKVFRLYRTFLQNLPKGPFEGAPHKFVNNCVRAFAKEGHRKPKITGISQEVS